LRTHPAATHPDLIVGTSTSDDAGVYRLSGDRALVQTVDFFTPVVDDAYDWGRIAATNALSDVYAMGGTPLTALQMVGWPRGVIPFEVLGDVIRGGADVMAAAGCTIVGGHSIDDAEPKYGFAVTGLVDPGGVVTNAAARPGDVLVLTKPIGTGIIATAIKRGGCPENVAAAAVGWMTLLNEGAALAMRSVGVKAATDVTGFGLLGHLIEITSASVVSAVIDGAAVPVIDGAWGLLDAGYYPGGSERNVDAVKPFLIGSPDPRSIRMLSDAQTSGGLLMAVAPNSVDALRTALSGHGMAVVIGSITDEAPGTVRVT
jgi:selenide, water dikinase